MPFGIPDSDWLAIKAEAKAILKQAAQAHETVTYGLLVERLRSVKWIPRDPRLFQLLGEISSEEAGAGRGMLSALVVTQNAGKPGPGFFQLAKELGRDTADPEQCWVREVQRVFSACSEGDRHGGD